MSNMLLLQKKVNLSKEHIYFLNFIHPNFEIIDDICNYNPNSAGIIYIGQYENHIDSTLSNVTCNWIIVNAHHFDLDLTTNEGLIKNILPIHYSRLKSSKTNELVVYNNMSYDTLLEKIKVCLITGTQLSYYEEEVQSAYSLYQAILSTSDILDYVYFNTVNKNNVQFITSSLLTFLNKVQSNNVRGASQYYSQLISQSNRRYGKKIKSAICSFIKSKASKEIALHQLVTNLNRFR